MKVSRIALIAALLLTPIAAHADTFSVQIAITGGQTFTYTKTIPGATGALSQATLSFAPWVMAQYPNTCSPQPCTPAATTPATAFALFGAALYQGIVANVTNYLNQQATSSALAGVTPMQ
jgi:hypothetical protein